MPAAFRNFVLVKVPVSTMTYKAYLFRLEFLYGRENIPESERKIHSFSISKASRSSSLVAGVMYFPGYWHILLLFNPGYFETQSTTLLIDTTASPISFMVDKAEYLTREQIKNIRLVVQGEYLEES